MFTDDWLKSKLKKEGYSLKSSTKKLFKSNHLEQKENTSKRNKYGAIRTTIIVNWRGRKQALTFDSKGEAERFQTLLKLEKAGKIKYLNRQEKFVLFSGKTYIADFFYKENDKWVIEDYKGAIMTQVFKLKWADIKKSYPQFIHRISTSKGVINDE